mmetsp:Transcript_10470/g.23772  ORF Transcript_10470/g.23772 Transcript_10470/m.23772 type:complete len:877 (+) Transcript_10470:76-2706(+)
MKFSEILKSLIVKELENGYIDYERLASEAEEICTCSECSAGHDCSIQLERNQKFILGVHEELYRVGKVCQQHLTSLEEHIKFLVELLKLFKDRVQKENEDILRAGSPRGGLVSRSSSSALVSTGMTNGVYGTSSNTSKSVGTDEEDAGDAQHDPAGSMIDLLKANEDRFRSFLVPLSSSSQRQLQEAYERAFQVKQMCELNLTGFRKLLKKREKTIRKRKKKDKKTDEKNADALEGSNKPSSNNILQILPLTSLCCCLWWCYQGQKHRKQSGEDVHTPLMGSMDPDHDGIPAEHSRGSIALDAEAQKAELPGMTQVKSSTFWTTTYPGTKRVAKEIENMFATSFTGGDLLQAQRELRAYTREAPPVKTFCVIGLWTGVSAALGCVNLFMWSYPRVEQCPNCTDVLLGMIPVFRLTFIPILWLLIWSLLCYIWRRHNVNYPYILDINPKSELGIWRGTRMAVILLALWSAMLTLFLYTNRTGVSPILNIGGCYFPAALVILNMLMAMSPPGVFHHKTRRWFFESIKKTVAAPFYEVRLRENFVADVLTSMVKELADLAYSIVLFSSGDFTYDRLHHLPEAVGRWSPGILAVIPFWLRMLQCIRRYLDSCADAQKKEANHRRLSTSLSVPLTDYKVNKPLSILVGLAAGDILHVVNAIKYLTCVVMVALSVLGGFQHIVGPHVVWTKYRISWFGFLVLSTVYAYLWDIIQDMGLIRIIRCDTNRLGWTYMVRTSSVFYNRKVFWWVAITNLLGRCAWAITIVPHHICKNMKDLEEAEAERAFDQLIITITALIEVCRRGQWTLFRIEHEYSSNPNNYQSFSEVPSTVIAKVQEDQEDKAFSLTRCDLPLFFWCSCTAIILRVASWYYDGYRVPGHATL